MKRRKDGRLRLEPFDLVIITLIALLVFGASRLPRTLRAFGHAIREYRNAVSAKSDEPPTPRNSSEKIEQDPLEDWHRDF